jgi:cytochrome c peroxidase
VKQRLSADNTVACATCHRPEHAFSEPTAVSTGIGGQKGRRKAPSLVNQADALLPHFFWDGRVDVKMEPLGLSPAEVDAIVAFLETLEGQGYQDKAPQAFPQ